MAAMALGMLVSAYGLYVERHAIRALVQRHAQVQRRLARGKLQGGRTIGAMRPTIAASTSAKPGIVAIGADNVAGFGKARRRGSVASSEAYLVQLQVLLRGQG